MPVDSQQHEENGQDVCVGMRADGEIVRAQEHPGARQQPPGQSTRLARAHDQPDDCRRQQEVPEASEPHPLMQRVLEDSPQEEWKRCVQLAVGPQQLQRRHRVPAELNGCRPEMRLVASQGESQTVESTEEGAIEYGERAADDEPPRRRQPRLRSANVEIPAFYYGCGHLRTVFARRSRRKEVLGLTVQHVFPVTAKVLDQRDQVRTGRNQFACRVGDG